MYDTLLLKLTLYLWLIKRKLGKSLLTCMGRLANYPAVSYHKIVQTLGLNLFKNSPFMVVFSVPFGPLNSTQAEDDNLMLQTFLLFMCKLRYCYTACQTCDQNNLC